MIRILLPLCCILLRVSLVSTSARADQPNIVIILADDLGYGSLNSYGADESHIRTPNIDRLGKEGRRFTDANAPSSVCADVTRLADLLSTHRISRRTRK